MALNPAMVTYREEFLAAFETNQTLLRDTVMTESLITGNQAIILVTAQAEAMKQRGVDGLIPASNEVDTQQTIQLTEMHHRTTVTNWDIFQGQADRRRIMQMRGINAANKEIDDNILTALSAATTTYGTTITTSGLTLSVFTDIMQTLYANQVPNDGGITCVWTPKMFARLLLLNQFTSSDWQSNQPMVTGPQVVKWMGANHIMHPRLTGVGTSTATCYVYHKSAIAHAVDTAGVRTDIGYNGEHDYSYARHSIFHGSKVLQNAGVLKITSNDTTAP